MKRIIDIIIVKTQISIHVTLQPWTYVSFHLRVHFNVVFQEFHPISGKMASIEENDQANTIEPINQFGDNFKCHNGYAMAAYRSTDIRRKLTTEAPTNVSKNALVILFWRICGNPTVDIS